MFILAFIKYLIALDYDIFSQKKEEKILYGIEFGE
jgi:hypothetical protein